MKLKFTTYNLKIGEHIAVAQDHQYQLSKLNIYFIVEDPSQNLKATTLEFSNPTNNAPTLHPSIHLLPFIACHNKPAMAFLAKTLPNQFDYF
ncbi:hypothetical protein ACSBR2_024641 [Camellia fascicularis]